MVRKSHARCRQCGKARHSNARFNLCAVCWAKRKPDHKAAWREMKSRRRAREHARLALHLDDAPPTVEQEVYELTTDTDTSTNGRVMRPLNDDQELELVDLYTKHDISAQRLAERFHVPSTYPYKVLERLGITWRQNDEQSFDEWQASLQKPTEPTKTEPLSLNARNAQKREAGLHMAERIPAALRAEIVGHYSDPRIPTSLIASQYSIAPITLMDIVRVEGVRMRNSQPDKFFRKAIRRGHFEKVSNGSAMYTYVEDAPEVRQLPPQVEAMRQVQPKEPKFEIIDQPREPEVAVPPEPEIVVEPLPAIPPKLTPAEPVPQTQGLVFRDDNEPVWEITYTGKMLVKAPNAREAIERAERDGHITTIVGVNMRSSR